MKKNRVLIPVVFFQSGSWRIFHWNSKNPAVELLFLSGKENEAKRNLQLHLDPAGTFFFEHRGKANSTKKETHLADAQVGSKFSYKVTCE